MEKQNNNEELPDLVNIAKKLKEEAEARIKESAEEIGKYC